MLKQAIFLALLAIFCSSLVAGNIFGAPVARSFYLSKGDHYLLAVGTRKDGKSGSRVEHYITTNLFPRFRVRYFHHSTDANSTTLNAYKFRVGLYSIIEFIDSTGNGYMGNKSSIVSTWSLIGVPSALAWSTMKFTSLNTNTTGVNAWELSTTLIKSNGANITIIAAISENICRDLLRNRYLSPNAIKFNVDINNWVYTKSGTKLALVFGIDAKDSLHQYDFTATVPFDPTASESQILIGPSSSARLSWVQNVTAHWIDNHTDPNGNYGFQLYNRSNDISWSPPTTDDDDYDVTEQRTIVVYTVNTYSQPNYVWWDPAPQVDDASLDAVSAGFATAAIQWLVLATCMIFTFLSIS